MEHEKRLLRVAVLPPTLARPIVAVLPKGPRPRVPRFDPVFYEELRRKAAAGEKVFTPLTRHNLEETIAFLRAPFNSTE